MKPDDNLIFLMDKAKAIAGSDYKLAKLVATTPQKISDWRHGRQKCPPERMAVMAEIAGFDAVQTLLRATVENYEGTEFGDRLMRVLGKALLATGGVIASAGANAAAIYSLTATPTSTYEAAVKAIQCIKRRIRNYNNSYVKQLLA